ncbi:MAG: hypothetical protein ACK56I_12295, partial [bacterium]
VGFLLPTLPVFGARHVARLHRQHHGVHEVLGRLDERGGGVQAGDDKLAGDVLHVRLHLASDVELVAVEGDPLQVGDEILLGGGLGALVGDHARQLVELCARFGDLLGRVDNIHGCLERAAAPREICHLHHDETHVLGQNDDVVAVVVPL